MTRATVTPEPLFRLGRGPERASRRPQPPAAGRRGGECPQEQHDRASTPGGGLTLGELLVGVWEGLSADHTVPCPACGGAMAPRYGAGPGPVGGRCGDCGTTIE